jgi:hypothetical protein
MEMKEVSMAAKREREMTRREIISKAFLGVTGALLASLLPGRMKETRREEFERNISDRDASYYKRLLG